MTDDEITRIRAEIAGKLSHRFHEQRMKANADANCKRLDEELTILILSLGEETIETENFKGTVVSSSNAYIGRDALILAGVGVDIVNQCTKRTSYTYVKVTERKQKDGDA